MLMLTPRQVTIIAEKKRRPVSAATKCGCCGDSCRHDDRRFCFGCRRYICGRWTCGAAVMGLGHEPWRHRPCDVCGESVADDGAHRCGSCQ